MLQQPLEGMDFRISWGELFGFFYTRGWEKGMTSAGKEGREREKRKCKRKRE